MTVTRGVEGVRAAARTGSDFGSCSEMVEKHWGPTRTVIIDREFSKSIGISIVGGKIDVIGAGLGTETLNGIFIKHVMPNSLADNTGQFKAGDRILEVSGINLRHSDHTKAVQAIKNASSPVKFVIQSLVPWSSKESESFDSQKSINRSTNDDSGILETINEINKIAEDEKEGIEDYEDVSHVPNDIEKTPAESSDEDDLSDDDDAYNLEGRTITKKGIEIDRASAGFLKRTKEEIAADPEDEDEFGYTMNKVRKKYASLGGESVVMVQLERNSVGGGLGISLAGHRDRNCMAVFVCGLNPQGAAAKQGTIQVGDEILEVNGIVLHGRCHLNASAIIKGLTGPVFKVIILRRKKAVEDLAVRPITHFPVALEEESPEERYSNYPNVRVVPIKKGTQSLGIMIIEGRHAEVGQGIFISDIQDGSLAEKAGLDIGEMILAVNNDTLLGTSYDTAAGILKRAEGVVNLVISNLKRVSPVPSVEVSQAYDEASAAVDGISDGRRTPHSDGRKTPQSKQDAISLKAGHTPSRPATPIGEPAPDPSTCQIQAGKETVIEVSTDNKPLGLSFVGGNDTNIAKGIVVLEVYPDGAADRDGRLQPGDQIVEVNGTNLLNVTNLAATLALRQQIPKFKMIIYRPSSVEMQTIQVDLAKKAGKGIGLSVMSRKRGNGVFVAEVLNGSSADVDGQLMRGDLIVSVNDQSVEKMSAEEVALLLKTATGRVSIKLSRHKPTYSR